MTIVIFTLNFKVKFKHPKKAVFKNLLQQDDFWFIMPDFTYPNLYVCGTTHP